MWLLRSISGEEVETQGNAEHFNLGDAVQTSDGQELEAEYNFDAFNKVPPHNEVSSASKSMDLHELRLAKCVQALGQLEVGFREVRECADQMPEFGRLQQMIQKQEQVIAQALQEVSAPDVPENPLVRQLECYEVLAADHRTLEEQVNQLAAVAEELTDALEESKTLESQLSHDLATSQQQLTEAVARISQLESESAAALRQTVATQETELAAERAHVRELQLRVARVELEWNLEQALKKKGRSYNFRHFADLFCLYQ